jgi:CRISPR/Cas system-associated exonuclease Cas4 (RecB family)
MLTKASMLTEKQLALAKYLIKKIGFVEDNFLKDYFEQLSLAAADFKYLEAIPITDDYETIGKLTYKVNGRIYEKKHEMFVPKYYTIIDFLNYELKVKDKLLIKEKKPSLGTPFITATDLSNFTYCPVRFSIAKTFELPKIASAFIGTDLHKDKRLVNYLFGNAPRRLVKAVNEEFFNEIKDSSLVFNGHDGGKKYFVKGDYAGQPDYIFKNIADKYFVVEEKFQFQPIRDQSNQFYNNHINQLSSYIYGINDYKIQYGYLVYWKFEYEYGNPYIHSCRVIKIEKNEVVRDQLISVYKDIKDLINNKTIGFDNTSRNPNKCANCISNLLCGHKTGKFSTLTYPYSKEYLKTTN